MNTTTIYFIFILFCKKKKEKEKKEINLRIYSIHFFLREQKGLLWEDGKRRSIKGHCFLFFVNIFMSTKNKNPQKEIMKDSDCSLKKKKKRKKKRNHENG